MIFCSGQIPADKDGNLCQGDIQACTKQVINNLENVLKSAGSGLEKGINDGESIFPLELKANVRLVVKMNIFLASMDDFAKVPFPSPSNRRNNADSP